MRNRQIPFAVILLALACCAFLQNTLAVSPAPVGGYPGENTTTGQNALLTVSTGTFNTAVGWSSLKSLTGGNFNTAEGAGALALNTADEAAMARQQKQIEALTVGLQKVSANLEVSKSTPQIVSNNH